VSAPYLLVSQGNYVFFALAKRGNPLQSAFGLWKHAYRTKAIDRVSVIGKIPAPALASRALREMMRVHGWLRRKAVRTLQRD
jgi:hypothetical protein